MSELDRDGVGLTIEVSQSDIKDLTMFNRSDLVFAVLYGFLFVIGFVLTVISI